MINLFIVWILTGLWHGAGWNYIVWGLGYFLVIAAEKLLGIPKRIKGVAGKTVYRIFCLLFINFQWVIFRNARLHQGLSFIKQMLVPVRENVPTMRAAFLLKDYFWFILAAVILAIPLPVWIKERCEKNQILNGIYQVLSGIVIAGAFLIACSFVINGQNNPFLYGNF